MARVTTSYFAQYLPAGADDKTGWRDLSGWDEPGMAFAQNRRHQASWDALADQDGRPQRWQVVKRQVSDTVLAPEEA
jgi:hypothetical protein